MKKKLHMTELGALTASELVRLFETGEASPVDATKAVLERIERFNPSHNAFAFAIPDAAMDAARESERRWRKKKPLSLIDGVPTTIKELTPVIGVPWRRGSVTGSKDFSLSEILIVQRLRQAGATIIGTTTSPEFGWKGVTHGPYCGVTVNPWNRDRTSGGSSGGAGVAAALNMGMLHEGSDAAGSIRIPASFCGVFGFKPTLGWIPQDSPSPLFELTQRGSLTRTVEDAALFLSIVTGSSPLAMTAYCPPQIPDWREIVAKADIVGMRIGYSRTLGYAKVAPKVAEIVDRAVKRLADLGAVVELADPGFASPRKALQTLWYAAEARTIDLVNPTSEEQQEMDKGLLAAAEEGRKIRAVDYLAAQQVCADLKVDMAFYHQKYDVMITPAMPLTAFKAGLDVPPGWPGSNWLDWSPFTYPFNMTGQPTASVPCGFDDDGMPIGFQIVGPRYGDEKALRIAAAYQRAFPESFPA